MNSVILNMQSLQGMEEGVLSMIPTNWLSYSTSKKIVYTYILLLDLLYIRIKTSSSVTLNVHKWLRLNDNLLFIEENWDK